MYTVCSSIHIVRSIDDYPYYNNIIVKCREHLKFDATGLEQRREEIAKLICDAAKLLSDADRNTATAYYHVVPADGSHIPRYSIKKHRYRQAAALRLAIQAYL